MGGPPAGLSSYLIAREDVDGGVDTVSQEHATHLTQATVSQELGAVTAALKEEKAKSCALEEENKALRGQVVTVLSYLDQVMPMEGGGDTAATKNTEPAEPEPEVEAEPELEQEHAIHLTQATASEELVAVTAALKEEKAKSCALEEENKALREQVASILSFTGQG